MTVSPASTRSTKNTWPPWCISGNSASRNAEISSAVIFRPSAIPPPVGFADIRAAGFYQAARQSITAQIAAGIAVETAIGEARMTSLAEPLVASPIVRQDLADGVLRLTLDNQSRRNALSEAMMSTLQGALDDAASSQAVRVVILAARGPAFCAGHDLKELSARRADPDRGRDYFVDLFAACARLMTTIV
eukprot:gene22191-23258_t